MDALAYTVIAFVVLMFIGLGTWLAVTTKRSKQSVDEAYEELRAAEKQIYRRR